jgi:shikimate dehydrogenase/3-dehydroquinate dehydratase type I
MTKIVASLVERDIRRVEEASKAAFAAGADLVELRADMLEKTDLRTLEGARRAIQGPAIATLRSKQEGGRSNLTGQSREKKLWEILECGFEYVDFELGSDKRVLSQVRDAEWRPLTIASCHFQGRVTRSRIETSISDACGEADIGKVAMPCEHAGDALMLAQVGLVLTNRRRRYVLVGMGQQGQLTRACVDKIGSELVYACLPGKEAASGQMDVALQRRLLSQGRMLFGLLGHPVSHSVSKPMQEAALREAGLKGAYLPLDFPPEALDRRALSLLRTLGFSGLNVTIPHKEWAHGACTRLSPSAESGAVNTILFERKRFVGENTDVFGFARLLDGKIDLGPKTRCLLVGAGGVARAVAHVLAEKGAILTVTDVDMERARRISRKHRARTSTVGGLWKLRNDFDLIVNCSPVGMKGVSKESPVKPYMFRPGVVFVDVIFNPPTTEAMRLARKAGATAYGGLEMLVHQGAESFRLWTGITPNVDAMREAAQEALR